MILLLLLFVLFQTLPTHAATPHRPSFNPALQQTARLLQSFQKQVESKEDHWLPAHLTKDLYTAGQLVTGQLGVTLSNRSANEQEKKLYLTIAFTMGIDLSARWQFIAFPDVATYFEKCFGLKEGELLHTYPSLLQSKRLLKHCFLMTLAALIGYQATTIPLRNAFTTSQAHYNHLKDVINRSRVWLEPLLTAIHMENNSLYPALLKIYSREENCYYLLKEEGKKHTLETLPKPLQFTRKSELPLTPWHPTPKAQLHHLLSDDIPSQATIGKFSQKIRNLGFIVMSREEAQNFFIALWLYKPDQRIIESLSQGLDRDLYKAFSVERSHVTGPYFGTTLSPQETVFPFTLEEEKPHLFLQLVGGGSNLSDSF